MSLLTALIVAFVSFITIAKSADLVIMSTVKLARKLHVSEFSIGFFVLGLATSTPELFVGLSAIADGHPQLSLGNLIGASIILLSLIIGLNALISGEVHFVQTFTQKDLLFTSFIIISPALFILDGILSRFDGFLLILLYVIFYVVMTKRQTFIESIRDTLTHNHNHIKKTIFLTIVGILGLFVSSKFIVESIEVIAQSLNIPYVVLGLLLVSIGTNIPEFTVLFKAIRLKHRGVSIGDFLGSAAANTIILGFVALLSPITLEAPLKVFLSLAMLLVTLITFNAFFSIDKKIMRIEGAALVGLYFLFLFSEVFLKSRL